MRRTCAGCADSVDENAAARAPATRAALRRAVSSAQPLLVAMLEGGMTRQRPPVALHDELAVDEVLRALMSPPHQL